MKSLILRIVEQKHNYSIRGDHVYIHCPMAHKYHEKRIDTIASLAINLETSKYLCFSCGMRGTGVLDLKKLLNIKNFAPKSSEIFIPTRRDKTELKSIDSPKYCSSLFSSKGRKGLTYIQNRVPTYTKKEIFKLTKEFSLKYCYKPSMKSDNGDYYEYLIIPIKCLNINSFTARATNNNKLKHKHPKGSRVGSLLLNYNKCNKSVIILVEGPFDLFRVWLAGYKHVVATFGKEVSPEQKTLLLEKQPKLTDIIIMFDGDGIKKAQKLKKELSLFFNVNVCKLNEGSEPDLLSKSEMNTLIGAYYHERLYK